jgi:hypothetical protein
VRQVSRQSGSKRYGVKKLLVLSVVENSDVPLSPKQVFDTIVGIYEEKGLELDIKYSTVRNYLADLHRDEKLIKPHNDGYYCSTTTYSVAVGFLRVHCVHFCVSAPFLGRLGKFSDFEELHGGIKIHVEFGVRNKQVSGFIANDVPGMDCNCLVMAFNRVYDIVELVTGKTLLGDVSLNTWETNRDFLGRRLDGQISCLTKKDLFDVIERVYQKEDDTVRAELKVTGNWKVEEAVNVLKGNASKISTSQGLYDLKRVVDGLWTVGKSQNKNLCDVISELQFVVRNHDSDVAKIEALGQLLVEQNKVIMQLKENENRLIAVVEKLHKNFELLLGSVSDGNGDSVKKGVSQPQGGSGDNPFRI